MNKNSFILTIEQFHALLQSVQDKGYDLYGPTIKQEVIVLDKITSANELPIGWMDIQSPGKYRLEKRKDQAYFGYNLGPHSWKKYLFPPKQPIYTAHRQPNGLVMLQEAPLPEKRMAFLAVRACELRAMQVQDKVFIQGSEEDPYYKKRRENLLIIAVNCTRSVGTCFCVSMECGPRVSKGFDISLTEVIQLNQHYFVAQAGSQQGNAFLEGLSLEVASDKDTKLSEELVQNNADHMERSLNTENLHQLLENSYLSKRWNEVGSRCVQCANCTMVCPTCFCSTENEVINMQGDQSEKWRTWESCFNLSHSYVHGGSVRSSSASRYRQWLTHKFGTWWDQFGTSGCVGCGRCITWCPVGIDVTEELKALREESNEKHL